MSEENARRDSAKAERERDSMGRAASGAFSTASEKVGQTTDKIKRAASDTASSIADQIKELLDRQVGGGADMVGHFANSARCAADDLDRNAPQLAGFVRVFAERVESYGDDLRDQSVDELLRRGSDFTKRQPALMFGLAALAGFFAFRILKSTPSTPSPSIQPAQEIGQEGERQFHGT